MRPRVFADTAYFLALINPRDTLHASALAWSRTSDASIVTTAWIVQELADGLAAPPWRDRFLRILSSIEADGGASLVPFDEGLWRRGLALYAARPDKGWSLTDCISFVVMSERGLTDALTGDHHFEQAGFRAILRTE